MSDHFLQRCSVSLFSARGVRSGAVDVGAGDRRWRRGFFRGTGQPEARYASSTVVFREFYEQEKMLADRPRMAFYHAAIARTSSRRPGDRSWDGHGIWRRLPRGAGGAGLRGGSFRILRHAKTLAWRTGFRT